MIRAPFIWIALSFTAGILLQPFYSKPLVWPFLASAAAFLFFLRGKKLFNAVLCGSFILLGMISADLDRNAAPSSLWNEINKEGTENFFAVTGKVNTEPEAKIHGRKQTLSFIFHTSQTVRWQKEGRGKRRNVSGKLQVFLNQPGTTPEIGDTLRLWGRFEKLPPVLNPGGFDYKEYLRARDVDFIFNAYGAKSVRILRVGNPYHPLRMLSKARQEMRGRINALFSEKESLLIRALILGDRKNLSGEVMADFLKTGTTHLLAISGLNISMVAGSFYLILIMLRVGQKKAAFFALLLALLQVAVGGFGIPVQRAGIMAGLGFLALILERERSSLNVFALAFFILLLADTRSLASISFQLSFLSLFCLILFTQLWNGKWSWAEAWASSAAILAGTFPVVLYHFSTFSPIGIAANILAIPLFHFVLLTACLSLLFGNFPWLGLFLKMLCGLFLKLGLAWIHVCASVEWGYFFLPRPSWGAMILYYFFLTAVIISFLTEHPKRKAFRAVFFSAWCCAAVSFFIQKSDHGFNAVFFSAGTNEIAHLEFGPDNHWLINSGRTFPGDQARWILHPYLRSEGIKKLKGIFFTDYRKRHTAGFETLQRDFQFQHEIYPLRDKSAQSGGSSQKIAMGAGGEVRMPEGGRIHVLARSRERLLLRVEVQNRSLLFLPDISFDVFQRLLETKGRRTDVLVIPAVKEENIPLLKSILTVTAAGSVIAPRMDVRAYKILEQRGVKGFDLAGQGALLMSLEKEGEHKDQFRVRPFLFPEKINFI